MMESIPCDGVNEERKYLVDGRLVDFEMEDESE